MDISFKTNTTNTRTQQDPSSPYQDRKGIWHVFPDCWPTTWNDKVVGGGGGSQLGWCHMTSKDLVRWTNHGPAVWFDPSPAFPNGSGFSGNCGTGGGAINAKGELVAYWCVHTPHHT